MKNFLVLFTFWCLTGCQTSPAPTTYNSEPKTTATNASSKAELASKRQNDFKMFIAGCQLVVDRTQDKEARELLSFLKEHGKYARDIPENMPSFNLETLPTFNVFVLEPGDQPQWAQDYLSDPLAVANFHPPKQSMVLRHADDYSPLWLGITALHETRHARAYLVSHIKWVKDWVANGVPDTQVFCFDEAQTHMFHGRLLRKLGGAAYELLIAKLLPKLEATAPAPLKEVFNQNGTVRSAPLEYPNLMMVYPSKAEVAQLESELDTIFGQANTDRERFIRISLISIDLNFVLADKYAKDPLDSKAFYLLCHYQKNGMAGSR